MSFSHPHFLPSWRALIITALSLGIGLGLFLSGWDIIWRDALMLHLSANSIWSLVSGLGNGGIQVALCCSGGAIEYLRGRRDHAKVWLWAMPIALLAGIFAQIIKRGLARPRPELYPELYDPQWWEHTAHLHSFPSGHTITSFALVAVLARLYPRTHIPLLLLATAIGVSRIVLGAHWPGDIVFGAGLGYACGISFVWIKRSAKP